jgi:hypothetical protein
MPICNLCGVRFPDRMFIDGTTRVLNKRKYCLDCSPFDQHNTKVLIGDTRPNIKVNQPPSSPLMPSEDLAYLIGIISGDGCLYNFERTCELIISCDNDFPELIEKYAALLKKMIAGNIRIQRSSQGDYSVVRLINKHLPLLLGLRTGSKVLNDYVVPEWIFTSNDYVKPFIRGLIETDGGIYIINRGAARGWHCDFTSYYEPIMTAFMRGAEMLGFTFRRRGVRARLSVTAEVKRLIETLETSKFREYTY